MNRAKHHQKGYLVVDSDADAGDAELGGSAKQRTGSCCDTGAVAALDHGVPLRVDADEDGMPCCGPTCQCVECRKKDPYRRPESPKRWLILLLGIGIIIGPYYSFDNPAGTQNALRAYFDVPSILTPNSTQAEQESFAQFDVRYQMLYSLYSLPNTVLPMFGGVLVDVLGVRTMTMASSVVALAGHVMVVAGLTQMSWMTMWAGRAIFGIGTEALCVACRILIARWFMGREMALSMGVILAFGRFGSVINDNISALYDGQHVVGAWCIGALICTFSVLASLVAVWIDRDHELRWKEKYGIGGDTKEAAKGELKEVEEEGLASNKKAAAAAAYSDGDSTSVSSFGGISSSPAAASCCGNSAYFDSVDGSASSTTAGSVPLLAADSLESGNCCGGGDADPSSGGSNQQRRQQSSSDDTNNSNSSSTASAPKKVSMLADVCSFGPAYWILAPISLMGFPCITSFNGVASAFLTQRWIDEGQPHDTARVNAVMGILYTVAACLALFVGSVIDRAGRRAVFMASALCFVCLTHLLFAVTTAPAEALLVMLGLSFAVYAAAFWPSIAFVTPASAFGTAYGMMGAIQNAGLATVPLIISQLQPPHCSGSYQCVELMLTGMAATGVVLCCVAHVLERRHAAAVAAKDGASAASSSSSSSNGGSGSTSMSAKSIDDSVGLIARLRASLRRLVPALMGEAKMASDDFSDALEMQSSGAGGYARLPKEESDADFDR